jgi:hypothetical protein
VLLMGAILAPARRTVTAALRATGHGQTAQFHRYHRVLSHARWSGLAAGRVLLGLLVATFAPAGPLVLGVDETLERRRGKKIAPKGLYRDAVRSSKEYFVKASGLRWVCLMLLVPIPWAGRTWFVQRWQLEVTLEEARRHLGIETQRQWSEQAIRRTTPALLGLFSLVALLAHQRMTDPTGATRRAAWYHKERPTFADALALVRRELWRHQTFHTSSCACEVIKVPRAVVERLTETLCYVA